MKCLGIFNWNIVFYISDSSQPRQKGRLNTIERLYSMVSLLKKTAVIWELNRIIMIHISNKS